jgi:hypothetical protein
VRLRLIAVAVNGTPALPPMPARSTEILLLGFGAGMVEFTPGICSFAQKVGAGVMEHRVSSALKGVGRGWNPTAGEIDGV